ATKLEEDGDGEEKREVKPRRGVGKVEIQKYRRRGKHEMLSKAIAIRRDGRVLGKSVGYCIRFVKSEKRMKRTADVQGEPSGVSRRVQGATGIAMASRTRRLKPLGSLIHWDHATRASFSAETGAGSCSAA